MFHRVALNGVKEKAGEIEVGINELSLRRGRRRRPGISAVNSTVAERPKGAAGYFRKGGTGSDAWFWRQSPGANLFKSSANAANSPNTKVFVGGSV